MDLTAFAEAIGSEGPVGVEGLRTRGGARAGVRLVAAPTGVEWFQPDEMTVGCGAGTSVAELLAELGEHGQTVALPSFGTVGGALALGASDLLRLGRGPVRDTLLQARYVSESGHVVTAGGPTVKNVSGFDLCRLLVGSRGALGVIGEVILRTRPLPVVSRWFSGVVDPFGLLAVLYRPAAILWDGTRTWVCLEGHPRDVDQQASGSGLSEVSGPPDVPTGGRSSLPPATLRRFAVESDGPFLAEVGVGVVHHSAPAPPRPLGDGVAQLQRRLKERLDPTDRFGPLPAG